MKHTFLFLPILLCCLLGLLSCSKDDSPAEESPFFVFFDQPAIDIDTTPVAASTWLYGFTFQPLSDGQISRLGLKLPVTGTFTVRLWDLSGSNPTVLRETSITSATAHVPVYAEIPALTVKQNDAFGLSILANSFYRVSKQDGSAFALPLTAGHIRINSFNEMKDANALTVFPDSTNNAQVAPCVNVVFVAD